MTITGDAISYNRGMKFSTHDRDVDEFKALNCAKIDRSGKIAV